MKLIRRMLPKEAGQTLPMALILMLLGAIAIIPTLSLATTNLKATQSVNLHTREMYAADAGIDNALWYLQSDNRTKIINPTLQWPTDGTGITYKLSDSDKQPGEKVNNKEVQVNISTAWLLGGLSASYPVTQPASGVADWTLFGALNISDNNTYVIQVSTTVTTTTTLDNISVWMPQGYSIDSLTANVQINGVKIGGPGTNYQYVKNYTSKQFWRGGTIYKWDYLGRTFKDLSDIKPLPPGGGLTPADKYPQSVQLSFKYTVTPLKLANGFFPWIQLGNQSIAWDSSAGFFHIQSTSITTPTDNTTIEAYVPRGLPRYIGGTTSSAAAVQGDYIAIGNSLMTCCWYTHRVHGSDVIDPGPAPSGPPCPTSCQWNCLGKYYTESSATIDADFGPSDAKIEKAYLYWTGWLSTSNPDKEATLKVNGHLVGTDGTVTADRWYNVATSGSNGYQYACYADVSDRVKAIAPTGIRNTMFTVGAVNATPATTCASDLKYQAANAGWSMIIIYSSQQTAVGVHQIYTYDNLAYLWGNGDDVSVTFTISGFQAPSTNIDAKVGYFIAEGDPQIYPDYFQFRGQTKPSFVNLGDPGNHSSSDKNPYDNVFNSYSTSTGFTPSDLYGQASKTIGGVDLDIYNKDKDNNSLSGIVQPGDTQAQIRVQTRSDGIMMVYIVFSVTSTAITPGQEFNIGSMLYDVE
jgi:hypothetical protein